MDRKKTDGAGEAWPAKRVGSPDPADPAPAQSRYSFQHTSGRPRARFTAAAMDVNTFQGDVDQIYVR